MNEAGILDGYCYGPADLIRVWKGPSVLWLELTDPSGKRAEAIYEGCVYLPAQKGYAGLHLSLVQQVTAEQLLSRENPDSLLGLPEDSVSERDCLQNWKDQGLKFYIHMGNQKEFLVVAKNLNYRTMD